mmetsp:Transcript_21146/g.31903  ORF Transcript_21146/g.31903 Transcript_21146/m.31903 type:complete len:94 (+) Transcript_21146:3-284(+)
MMARRRLSLSFLACPEQADRLYSRFGVGMNQYIEIGDIAAPALYCSSKSTCTVARHWLSVQHPRGNKPHSLGADSVALWRFCPYSLWHIIEYE